MSDGEERATRSEATAPDLRHVKLAVVRGVAQITLNRPEHLNAIDHGPGSMEEEIVRAIVWADSAPHVRCVVLTGAGRAFSSGGDMGLEPMETPADHLRFLAGTDAANVRIRGCSKPTIGAINGMCFGVGLILALHLDLLVASEAASFGMIETRFGAVGVEMLPFAVGLQWAKFLALSGEVISARRAQEIGLVLAVFEPERFEAKVADLARRIAAMPADGVTLNRRLINGAATMMGWAAQKELAVALNSVTNAMVEHAENHEGQNLQRVLREQGWRAFKDARDDAFREPWLED